MKKLRSKWVKEGGQNSRVFHESLKDRHMRNVIVWLETSRGRIDHVEEIKFEAGYFFEKRFIKIDYKRLKLDGVHFNVISSESTTLESPSLLEEIEKVVWNSDGDESPGPDGYNISFF